MKRKSEAQQVVLEALYLDDKGHHETAYIKYLEGIQAIGGYLIEQVNHEDMVNSREGQQEAQKALSLVRQCLDRLDVLLTLRSNSNVTVHTEVASTRNCPTDYYGSSFSSLCNFSVLDSSLSCRDQKTRDDSCVYKNTFSSVPRTPTPSLRHSPMEQAQYENARLLRLFHARIARSSDPAVKANLNLELQRRLIENFAVSKAKQREFVKQEQKKLQVALELAGRKLSTLGESSADIRAKQQLYANILQYEEREEWPSELKQRFSTETPEAVAEGVCFILRSSDHPLSKWLSDKQTHLESTIKELLREHCHLIPHLPKVAYQNKKYCQAEELHGKNDHRVTNDTTDEFDELLGISLSTSDIWNGVSDTAVQEVVTFRQRVDCIVEDVSQTIQCVLQMLYLSYETLQKESLEYFCYETVEHHLFNTLSEPLLTLFRLANIRSERLIAQAMLEVHENGPQEFGIPPKPCDSQLLLYSEAVSHLERIPFVPSLLEKVQILVHICHIICEKNQQSEQNQQKHMGADDLIPILCYILVQTGLPQLISECQAIDYILDHRYMLGEEGYCLTSFQTALKYLEIKRLEKRSSTSSCDVVTEESNYDANVFL